MKRQLSLVLALVMILGTFTTVFAAPVVEADVVKEASDFLAEKKVLVGNMKGDLMLDENLSRQDTAVLVARLMGELDVAQKFPIGENIPTYEDIKDNFYLPVLAWAQANKTFVGHSDARFGFDDNVTAQEYSKVLLVALGHTVGPNGDNDVKYDDALATAKTLGILKDIDNVENKDEITRGEMAVMTFNALGVTMKDSTVTLAEHLKIEMPSAKTLTATVNDTKNLKEVVIELSNAKLADEAKLLEENNYRVDGKVAKRVTLDGNNVIVELKDALNEDKEYELKVRSVHNNVDGTYKFVARDNTIPAVDKVEVLGKYGIKVTLTEPVEEVFERDFLIDGRNVSMKTETYGRVVILTPYSGTFSNDIKTLTVTGLTDFAGFKSARADFDLDMVNDTVAPKVTDVIVRGKVVEVTFDKDIYKGSIKDYDNSRNVGNISYVEGRRTFYAEDDAVKTDTNKVEYKFRNELPRYATVTIEGVQNHSGVAMERTTQDVREVIDYTEPEVIETDVKTTGEKQVEIKLTFNKEIKGSLNNFTEHFALYNYGTVNDRNLQTPLTNYIESVKYENGTNQDDVVIVKLKGLEQYNDKEANEYVLEVKNFEDASSSRNIMFRFYLDFKVDEEKDFTVDKIKVQDGSRRNEREVVLSFSKNVDRRTADVLENYNFTDKDGKELDLDDLDGKVEYQRGSKDVVLVIPNYADKNLRTLRLSNNIKDDKDGYKLAGPFVWNLETELSVEAANKAAAKKVDDMIYAIPKAGDVELTDKDAIVAARAAYDKLTEDQQALVNYLPQLVAKEDKIAELEEVTLDKTALNVAKETAAAKVEADYTATTWTVLTNALALPEATQAEVNVKTAAINDAIAALALTDNAAAAKVVDDMIRALPTNNEMEEMSDTERADAKVLVQAARTAYEALSADEKALVELLNWLEAKETKIAELELGA